MEWYNKDSLEYTNLLNNKNDTSDNNDYDIGFNSYNQNSFFNMQKQTSFSEYNFNIDKEYYYPIERIENNTNMSVIQQPFQSFPNTRIENNEVTNLTNPNNSNFNFFQQYEKFPQFNFINSNSDKIDIKPFSLGN